MLDSELESLLVSPRKEKAIASAQWYAKLRHIELLTEAAKFGVIVKPRSFFFSSYCPKCNKKLLSENCIVFKYMYCSDKECGYEYAKEDF